jgi:hypothetical protein
MWGPKSCVFVCYVSSVRDPRSCAVVCRMSIRSIWNSRMCVCMFIVQDPRTCVVLYCMPIVQGGVDDVRRFLRELLCCCDLLLFSPRLTLKFVSQGEPDPTRAQRVFDPMAPKYGPDGRNVLKGLL